MDALGLSLINGYQRGFPLTPRPFATIAGRIGSTEGAVIERLAALSRSGETGRIGAVFAPGRVGAGTLAALTVPAERLAEVAAQVSAHPEVNHNYEREHDWNLWFVVTAPDADPLERALDAIEARARCGTMLRLPMIEGYHIDLGFPLGETAARAVVPVERARARLGGRERALASALQEGLELVPAPYAALGARAGLTEGEVIAMLGEWLGTGIVKRLGLIVRHHELGYRANAMIVWDVLDDRVADCGRSIAAVPYVTLCYRRVRCLPQWRYNLYCMIHGQGHAQVLTQIAELNGLCDLAAYPTAVLFSRHRFKQTAARYVGAENVEVAA